MEVKTEKQCICAEGFGMNLSCPVHSGIMDASEAATPPRQKSLEEIAEKWAMTLNGNHFHLPFDGPVMCYVRELFLLACTEACQSGREPCAVCGGYDIPKNCICKGTGLLHVAELEARKMVFDAHLRIQRLKEALEKCERPIADMIRIRDDKTIVWDFHQQCDSNLEPLAEALQAIRAALSEENKTDLGEKEA